MYWNEFERGYETVITKIEEIIDDQFDENNRKLKIMNEILQNVLRVDDSEKSKLSQLADKTSDTADYLSGMYKVKHVLMCSKEVVLNQDLDQDFEAGKKAALDIIETVIRESKKGLDQIEDKTKKEECIKRIFGAEFLYDQIEVRILEIYEEDLYEG